MDIFPGSGDMAEPVPKVEITEGSGESWANDAMVEVSKTADVSESDASWLETLFRRMAQPAIDVFEGEESGFDTERIAPSDAVRQGTEGTETHDISAATEQWHMQENNFSCAVCAQQFIINEFLELNLTEEQLCEVAESNGWYHPETGTSLRDIGNLLEMYGIDSHTNFEGSIEDIKATLDQGGRVIAAVDSMVLWVDGFGNYPVYGMDHAIEVIGIDDSNPLDVRVIINDSGAKDGCGQSVSYLEFMEAWAPSGGFMVSAFPRE